MQIYIYLQPEGIERRETYSLVLDPLGNMHDYLAPQGRPGVCIGLSPLMPHKTLLSLMALSYRLHTATVNLLCSLMETVHSYMFCVF